MKYLVSLHSLKPPAAIGNKALNLHRLWRKRFNIPKTCICRWNAYLDYKAQGPAILDHLASEVRQAIVPGRAYAVRSSANIEDSRQRSFAGQFASCLHVEGVEQILQAVKSVWDTAESDGVQTYLQRNEQAASQLLMAVIIQEMVEPVLSGVSFSRNPITGEDEIIVEAVHGDGTRLVQSGVTPLRWVSRWGALLERPQEDQLPPGLIDGIVRRTKQIAQIMQQAIDLEWVYDGHQVYWVQLRHITALAENDSYNNRLAREMTPGLIKPLVWSTTIPIHTRQWVRILNELVGETGIQPERLVKAFHYRAYYNMGQFGRVFASLGMPRDSLERMMGVLPPGVSRPKFMPGASFLLKAPRVSGFILDKLRFGERAEREYKQLQEQARTYLAPLSATDAPMGVLERVDQITNLQDKISYNTILSILLMQIYNGLLRKYLQGQGIDLSEFDLTDHWESLQAFHPNLMLADLHQRYLALEPQLRDRLRGGDLQALDQEDDLSDFRQYFQEFLDSFGHMSDSTVDFTSVPWRESPEMILRLVCEFTPPETKQDKKIGLLEIKASRLSHQYLRFIYRRARQFRLYREMYSSLYTYTLMLLRDHFHALGAQLAAGGSLQCWEDIFYLYREELWAWAAGGAEGGIFPCWSNNAKLRWSRAGTRWSRM